MNEVKAIEVKPGERFTWQGYEWIVLDPAVETPEGNGVLAIMAEVYKGKEMCFDIEGYNNYAKSSLRKMLNAMLLPELGEDNLLPHVVDLIADNGDKRYGTVTDKVFILSCDEYRKYREYVPLFDEWMWTCTPWYINDAGNGHAVRYVNTTGGLYSHYFAGSSNGVAPACVIASSIFNCADRRKMVKSE